MTDAAASETFENRIVAFLVKAIAPLLQGLVLIVVTYAITTMRAESEAREDDSIKIREIHIMVGNLVEVDRRHDATLMKLDDRIRTLEIGPRRGGVAPNE
mgnify:CR=1 FL=1